MEFYIYTDKTRYHCSICDVMMDDFNTNNEGFSSITVIPVGWHDDENGLFPGVKPEGTDRFATVDLLFQQVLPDNRSKAIS